MACSLQQKLGSVEFPTLGHFLEEGFLPPEITPVVPSMRMVGRARTVSIPDADAAAVNQAILRLEPGEILVLDLGAEDPHACVGAVTIAAIRATGAAGVLVNGLVTDLDELSHSTESEEAVPIFARGSNSLTTKRRASGASRFDIPVAIGNAVIEPGHWILGDRNGVLAASISTLQSVIDLALASDTAEPEILERIRAGEPLENILFLG